MVSSGGTYHTYERLVKVIYDDITETTRKRGRPWRRWVDSAIELLVMAGIEMLHSWCHERWTVWSRSVLCG